MFEIIRSIEEDDEEDEDEEEIGSFLFDYYYGGNFES